MKKKHLLSLIMAFLFTTLFCSSALAAYVESDGANTTPETALVLQRNQVTAESRIAPDLSKEHVAGGTLLPHTEHWYKAQLPVNPNTILTVNADYSYVEVYNENMSMLFQQFVTSSTEGMRAYYVPIQSAGMYYIRIFGALAADDYRVSIGNPHYNMNNTEQTLSTLTLNPGVTSVETSVNFTNSGFPRESVVYMVYLGGTRSAKPTNEIRSLKYANESTYKNSDISYFVKYDASLNKFLEKNWTIRWQGTAKSTMTWTPKVKFYYVYPVLPQ